MKKIMIFFMCIFLCACSNKISIQKQLDDVFTNEQETKVRANNYTDYVEYYLPSDVCEESCEPLSFAFGVDDCRFIMNINVSNIINSKYYKNIKLLDEGFFDNEYLVYDYTGKFVDINNQTNNFFINVYEYEDECLVYFVSSKVNYYGYCSVDKIKLLVSKIMQMVKATNVLDEKIITDFSSIDVVDYEKSTVNLFGNTMPKEGRIEEFIINKDVQAPQQ